MLKQLCIQAHSSSLRCGGSLCKVQHDKLYNASHCKSKKGAFTLAEVLITLVIIGVVAALTIPNLMQKYQEQTTVKKLQKFYSSLSNAFSLTIRDNGAVGEWGITPENKQESAEKIYEILFKPYFKIAKNCGTTRTGNCIADEYKYLNNISGLSYNYKENYKIVLDDGASLVFTAATNNTIILMYDVNGLKAPNQWGRDMFDFRIQNAKIFPDGLPGYNNNSASAFDTGCSLNERGQSCAAWVIYKGNMDYLHCDGLTWNSRSCKEK